MQCWINPEALETWAWSQGHGDLPAPWVVIDLESDLARLCRMTDMAWDLGDKGMPFDDLNVPPHLLAYAEHVHALFVERLERLCSVKVRASEGALGERLLPPLGGIVGTERGE